MRNLGDVQLILSQTLHMLQPRMLMCNGLQTWPRQPSKHSQLYARSSHLLLVPHQVRTQQSAAGGSDHFELAADWPPDPGRMRCTSVAQLIESWPNEEWCPAPLYAHLEDLVESVSVAATTGTTMNVAGHLYLCSATLAALRSASQSLMPDEALMYTLCTFAGPGCWVAFCELIWKGDAAYCSMALRVPSPIYSKTSGPFAKPPPNMSGVQVARVFNNAVGYSGVQPVAPFLETPPSRSTQQDTVWATWASRVSEEVVSRRNLDCERVKV
jgi:hypothetical protein